jgi:hypothetical protein
VAVGCGSLKITLGSGLQASKLVKMIIVVINFSGFIVSIFIFWCRFKMAQVFIR